MSKITVEKNLFCLPWTQTLLGTHVQGKVNFMALDWLTRTNVDPPMLGICVNNRHASNQAIRETGQYSVNVPTVDMIALTDYCGIVSAKGEDKSTLFEVYYGELKSAPLITSCPLNIECRLIETVDLPTNTFFIGEIVTIYSEEKYLSDGKPDVKKIRPFLLTMPDNRYWSVGEHVGNAWKDGAKYRETLKNEQGAKPHRSKHGVGL
ncbi:MAG TPA: flavin reductase family protein [Nitrospirota bacterium]|nr:flavin reductase family protein [Nitrospirota bacterium]